MSFEKAWDVFLHLTLGFGILVVLSMLTAGAFDMWQGVLR